MIVASNEFKTAMKQPIKEIQAFINYDENAITDADDLISYKISCDSGLCKTAMRKLEANYLGSHNLLGKWVNVGFGVKLPDGEFDFIDYGSFLVTELTETKDTETTSIVAYDKMVNAMTPYVPLDVEYPINLLSYTQKLCESCNLELYNVAFGSNLLENITSYAWWDNVGGLAEIQEDYIKVTMPETLTQYSGVYSSDMKQKTTAFVGKRVIYSFYAKADADRSILVSSAGKEGFHYIDLTTEWQRYSFVVENYNLYSPTFYCGDTLDKTPYYIKDIMITETNALTDYAPYNVMNDWQITKELWENIEGITYRDIFQQVAQATGSTCIIHDDKVYFKPIQKTNVSSQTMIGQAVLGKAVLGQGNLDYTLETLTYDNLFKLKLEALYGGINSVVLSRTPIVGEDVYLQNEADVQANGLTEFKIENNEIIDKDRENAITPIYDALNGISYYPFEATTEGLGWYEIGDNFNIINDKGYVFNTTLFNYTITVDGSVKETLKTTAESKTQTQYQYATTISKQLQKNTEIIVNKQEQYIKSIVEEKENGINKRLSTIEQDIENINFNVQNSGGSNLIKNSVMFAYDKDDNPNDWEVSGDGTLTIVSDVNLQKSGGISCHGFILSNKTVRTEKIIRNEETGEIERVERIPVKPFDENNPIYYTFNTKIKKDSEGTCYVKIYNPDIEEDTHIISLQEGETSNFDEHEIKALKPMGDQYVIEFYGSADSNVTFTDNMFAMGENKTQWTQANGEIMNTQVNISLDGIVVRSDTVLGDYTVISRYEFAGYSNVNGTMTKVFTLNKGVTEVKELLAKDSISMPPLKIVPITEGDMQGWAFLLA